MLEVKGLTVAYEDSDAVRDVSFTVAQGEWLMLIGPNGAGKSTLLAAVAQCAAYRGSVLLEGCDARQWKPKAFARAVGVLAQTHAAGYTFTVEELVSMGRYAHTRGFFTHGTRRDKKRYAALWTRLDCGTCVAAMCKRCPGVSSSALFWRRQWPRSRGCSCWMNRRIIWIWCTKSNCSN